METAFLQGSLERLTFTSAVILPTSDSALVRIAATYAILSRYEPRAFWGKWLFVRIRPHPRIGWRARPLIYIPEESRIIFEVLNADEDTAVRLMIMQGLTQINVIQLSLPHTKSIYTKPFRIPSSP